MKTQPALMAVALLERSATAALFAVRGRFARLARERHRLIESVGSARASIAATRRWSGAQCQSLAAFTAWAAAASAALRAQQRERVAQGRALARERLHWARCRVGLEHRSTRLGAQGRAREERHWLG